MNCSPDPEVTCGTTLPDTCIIFTGTFPPCLPGGETCYRQYDFNSQVGTLLCTLDADVTTILDSIDLTGLTGCTGITPIKGTVVAEFQNLYSIVCDLQTNLNLPIVGLNLQCLQNPCGGNIGTLGALLQALIDAQCDTPGGPMVYRAVLDSTGTTAPVVSVLENGFAFNGITIAYSYGSAGVYTITASSPIFVHNKTFILIGEGHTLNSQIKAFVATANTITILTGSSGSAADSILNGTALEIRVYS